MKYGNEYIILMYWSIVDQSQNHTTYASSRFLFLQVFLKLSNELKIVTKLYVWKKVTRFLLLCQKESEHPFPWQSENLQVVTTVTAHYPVTPHWSLVKYIADICQSNYPHPFNLKLRKYRGQGQMLKIPLISSTTHRMVQMCTST